jgi:hypothetical protein
MTEIDQCKLVFLGLSLAGYLVKPILSLYGTEWRERGYGRLIPSIFTEPHSAWAQYKKNVRSKRDFNLKVGTNENGSGCGIFEIFKGPRDWL